MILFYIVVLLYVGISKSCIYSQSYWLSNISEPWPSSSPILNQSLCGLSWYRLMHFNTSQTREPGAMHWLLAFHQLCTARLNLCLEEEGSGGGQPGLLPSSLTLSIEVIFDSMQRYCDNMYVWTQQVAQDKVLSGNLKKLIEYNHGPRVCKPVLFSFTHEPQLFFMGYNETEQSESERQATERQRLYNIQTGMGICLVGAILLIIALSGYILLIYKKKREYSVWKTATEPETYNASGCDHNIAMNDGDIGFEDIDLHGKPKRI